MKRPTLKSRSPRTSGRSGRSGRSRLVASGAGALLALVASAGLARAEPFPARGERVFSPGRSAASEDSGEALVLNPANLGFLTGKELRWTGVRCTDTQRVACGHSFDLSTPVMWGLGAGFRVDYISPPSTAGGPYFGQDYVWLTWGLGYSVSRSLSFGATLQTSFSPNRSVGGIVALSAGVSYRPSPRLAFGLVAHDFNGPASFPLQTGASRALLPVLDRQYVAAASFRPTGTRAFEVGAEVRYYDGADQARPRAVLGVDIPGVGRARGDVEVGNLSQSDPAYLATLGLELNLRGASLGGGAIVGNALGRTTDTGQYLTAGLAEFGSPASIPRSGHAVTLRLEATPGTRSHVRLLRRLWRLSERSDIEAVTLLLRDEPATSFAHAEELADAFRLLRARGKKVVCSFETAGPKGLFACASADRVVLNPAGGVRYSGLKSTHIYLAGLLDKIGVKAEFVRIGAHKSAPEQLMNRSASDVARADQEDLLRNNEAVFVRNMSLYRHMPEAQIREVTRRGPFVAVEARDAKLVDTLAFDDELDRVTQDVVGRKVNVEKYVEEAVAPLRFGQRNKVGLLYVDGDMIDGRSSTVPLLGMKLCGSYTIAESAKRLREDSSVRAVVLRVETPGGSSLAADVMWRELRLLAQKKPLIVSMGSIAASGGYYVAAAGTKIYALPLTVTGSIGIFYGKADVSGLLAKLGVNVEVRKTTPRADAESFFRGFTPDERTELERKVGQFYDVFVDRVSQGRKLTREQVDAVGQGRVWAGQQALDKKLVDEMGGLRHALEHARKAANLPEDAPIQEEPPVTKSLLETALELAGYARGPMVIDGLPVQVKDVVRAVAPMAVYADSVPLARMEWETLGENGVDDD
ncbi:MAG TPA: signal peptide peptidase SppA [Polyangiaceae bacterium]|nr:signal peptide peptidase SppA [Polyangiaceae bacterium]